MLRNLLLAITVLIIIANTGCFMIGKGKKYHPFDPVALEQVQPGTTLASDVANMFGAPTKIVEMSNGNAYVYQRSVAKATLVWLVLISFGNYDTQTDQIVFFFNNEDLLTHYGVSMNAEKAGYGLPF